MYTVTHSTRYDYNAQVSYCHNLGTIKPRECAGQELLQHSLEISPEPTEVTNRIDFFGNYITRFSIQKPHKKLVVTSKSTIQRDATAYLDSFYDSSYRFLTVEQALLNLELHDPVTLDAKQYVLDSIFIRKIGSSIKQYAEVSFAPKRSVFEAAQELMQRIYTDFKFSPGFTSISTPIHEVMAEKKGVCQDFAQIAIACIRSVGLAARYVSGYIETLPPPGKPKLVGADASHAWFSIFIPGFGWIDFDPTNNQIPHNQHLVVGWGRDYYDVPPLKGVVYGSGKSKLKVSVDIRPAKYSF